MLGAEEGRFEIDLRDSVISLEPSPFYLGYGFRTKPLAEEYAFPFYYTRGGKGAVLTLLPGRWGFISQRAAIYVFPFQIAYAEIRP